MAQGVKLSVSHLSKTYFTEKNYFTAIEDVSFELYDGEFLVILGPGHCGKSVLLNIICGLEEQTGGVMYYDGREFSGGHEDISMVFQKKALLPYKTVMQNVEIGPKFANVRKKERREKAQYFIDLVGLQGFENSYPSQLSGGMKQRVGIARAYANDPKILIMDEPFGALDAQTRYAMQNEILKIREKEKRTVIFVTSNIEEALYLGDRIILLSKCPATVKEVYELKMPRPRDMVSAEFMRMRQIISEKTDLDV